MDLFNKKKKKELCWAVEGSNFISSGYRLGLLTGNNQVFAVYLLGIFLEKAMATHSSTLVSKVQWMEEPCRLQSKGSLRVRHNWVTSLSLFTLMQWRRKWQPTPVFLPGESQGWGAWWAAVYGAARSRTRLKWLSSRSIFLNSKRNSVSLWFPWIVWF